MKKQDGATTGETERRNQVQVRKHSQWGKTGVFGLFCFAFYSWFYRDKRYNLNKKTATMNSSVLSNKALKVLHKTKTSKNTFKFDSKAIMV